MPTLSSRFQPKKWRRIPPGRFTVFLGLAGALLVALALDGDGYLFILDDANLLFHEAGHVIFGLLGPTMCLYGGTLGQLSFPLVLAIAFRMKGDAVGCAAGAIWFFENWLNISRYMADARAQVLPLVGGGEHDWFAILSRWHALPSDRLVASVAHAIGWIGMAGTVAAVTWYFFLGQPGRAAVKSPE